MWTRNKKQTIEGAAQFRRNPARIGKTILTTLCAAIALYSGAAHATGTYYIYLYDANGNPVNVTSQYVYSNNDPHVFTTGGTAIGTVDAASYIDNASGQHIGYVVYDSGS